ncbi:hypothetical protein H5410_012832 [Solanum commersonii]|uniref:Uncharacterized protein n=1 Tax=Solanum commersonii TaxID=4109 RepID=A0A9J6ASS6_SOLCO|nr:hypothetical protein H5410_012832 [Solanum commersonii]
MSQKTRGAFGGSHGVKWSRLRQTHPSSSLPRTRFNGISGVNDKKKRGLHYPVLLKCDSPKGLKFKFLDFEKSTKKQQQPEKAEK